MKTETIALVGVGGVLTVVIAAALVKRKTSGAALLGSYSPPELAPSAVAAESTAAPWGRDVRGVPYTSYSEWAAANPVRAPSGGFKNYKVAPADNAVQVSARFNTPEGGIVTLARLNPAVFARKPITLTPGETIKVPGGVDRGAKRNAMGIVS